MLSRRAFLALGAAAIAAPSWASLITKTPNQKLYASAFSTKQAHFFGLFDEHGDILWQSPLPDRAHAPVVHPNQSIVGIVARRPGFFIDFFDMSSQQRVQRIEPEKDHHFYGHALFSPDGKKLITQENHYPTGKGKIFIRAWPSGNIIHAFSSNGIGPHESVFLNHDILVIANGGLKTHPDADRKILNLDTMKPNVTYMSLQDGKILNNAEHSPEYNQLSIRHLDINNNGTVALGFQYQGEIWDQVPLVALSNIKNDRMEYLTIPENIRIRFKQYCGSVSFDSSGKILAISTPRGGLVAYWDVETKTFLGVKNCRDVCGIAATGNPYEFFLTSGSGHQIKHNPVNNETQFLQKQSALHWDNHLRQLIV